MKAGYLLFLLFALFSVSCKKDKLKDEKEIFVGNWKWIYTDATLGVCENMPYGVVLDPATENCEYSISFEKKGKVLFFKNGVELNKYRIVFLAFGEPNIYPEGYTYFAIDLDNDSSTNPEMGIEGYISPDTLLIGIGFPFYDDGCSFYNNYFVKN